jgi:hypothetical protein|tara:strand:- start:13 stop:843 length:831 start_codon:yes stop_codon:yes gene_type:complete
VAKFNYIKFITEHKHILKEGITLNDDNTFNINAIKSSDDLINDPFIINRNRNSTKKEGIPVYYGISPNPNILSTREVNDIYNATKDANNISPEDLYKLIFFTTPEATQPTKEKIGFKINYLISLPSSAGLNNSLLESIKRRYKIEDRYVLTNISKIEYFIDDMINKEKYNAADPTTQNMASTWTRSLKRNYPDNPKMPIKKSGNPQTGHPGIQTGARHLLNPAYQMDQDIPKNVKILVIDDFLIGGSTLKEIFKILIGKGVPKENIIGYVLGSQKD